LGIKQILVVGSELWKCHDTDDFKFMFIDIDDDGDEDIFRHFEKTYTFINQKSTLVHCFAGISRSPSIVIAYLMKEYGMTYFSAFKMCKEKRCIVCPNNGFRKQLRKYEDFLEDLKSQVQEFV